MAVDRIQLFGIGFDTRQVETGTKRAQRAMGGMGSSAAKLRSQITIAAAAVAGAAIAFDKLTQKGGEFVRLQTAFAARVGNSNKGLRELRATTRGLVSDTDLLKFANQALILGAVDTVDEFGQMAEGAIRLGRAMGKGAAFSIESMTTGLARQSRLMLDNIGLIVKAEVAQQKFADSLGVAVSSLSDEDKRIAFINEGLDQMRTKVAALGSDTFTTADAMTQMKIAIDNATTSLGRFFAEGGGRVLIAPITGAAELLNQLADVTRVSNPTFDQTSRDSLRTANPSLFFQAMTGQVPNPLTSTPAAGGGAVVPALATSGPRSRSDFASLAGPPTHKIAQFTATLDRLNAKAAEFLLGFVTVKRNLGGLADTTSIATGFLDAQTQAAQEHTRALQVDTAAAEQHARQQIVIGQALISTVGAALGSLATGGGAGGFLGGLLGGLGSIVSGLPGGALIGTALGVGGGLVGSLVGGREDDKPVPVRIEDISDRALDKQRPNDPVTNIFFGGQLVSSGRVADTLQDIREFERRSGMRVTSG